MSTGLPIVMCPGCDQAMVNRAQAPSILRWARRCEMTTIRTMKLADDPMPLSPRDGFVDSSDHLFCQGSSRPRGCC